MAAMPLDAGYVVVGVILHFLFAAFLGVLFFAGIGAAAWFDLRGMRTRVGPMGAGMIGGALVCVLNRWIFLPPTNPIMAFRARDGLLPGPSALRARCGYRFSLTARHMKSLGQRQSPVASI